MSKEIPLQNGQFAIVDAEDYGRCMEHVWHYSKSATGLSNTVITDIDRVKVTLGRFILNHTGVTKHKNGDGLDFRKDNLDVYTRLMHAHSRKANVNSSSKYKGVSLFKKTNKWTVQIGYDGSNVHLGYFQNEDDAAKEYNAKAFEFFGEHAYMNVIGIDNRAKRVTLQKVVKKRYKKVPTSKYRGVSFQKERKKWVSQIKVSGKPLFLGRHDNEKQAAKAYDQKAFELHGDEAILNFPNE